MAISPNFPSTVTLKCLDLFKNLFQGKLEPDFKFEGFSPKGKNQTLTCVCNLSGFGLLPFCPDISKNLSVGQGQENSVRFFLVVVRVTLSMIEHYGDVTFW